MIDKASFVGNLLESFKLGSVGVGETSKSASSRVFFWRENNSHRKFKWGWGRSNWAFFQYINNHGSVNNRTSKPRVKSLNITQAKLMISENSIHIIIYQKVSPKNSKHR
jgi:hypothetical protein